MNQRLKTDDGDDRDAGRVSMIVKQKVVTQRDLQCANCEHHSNSNFLLPM